MPMNFLKSVFAVLIAILLFTPGAVSAEVIDDITPPQPGGIGGTLENTAPGAGSNVASGTAPQKTQQNSADSNDRDFVPLVPIAELETGSDPSLGEYFNSLFTLTISIAAMLAVLRLVYGGFVYMTQTASEQAITEARKTIRNTLIGLVLLVSVVLIFQTINPKIVSLEALNFKSLQSSTYRDIDIKPDRESASALTEEERKTLEEKARTFADATPETFYKNYLGTTYESNIIDSTNMSDQEFFAYAEACVNAGKEAISRYVIMCKNKKGRISRRDYEYTYKSLLLIPQFVNAVATTADCGNSNIVETTTSEFECRKKQ